MHELPIVKGILNVVLNQAAENNAAAIKSVDLEIGEMHDLVPEWVEKFFRFASKGTIAEDAELRIHRRPIICKCDACGEYFVLHLRLEDQLHCPVCGSQEFQLISGRELQVLKIEVC